MAKKRFGPERVVAKLRQIGVLTRGGKALPLACKEAGITDLTYHRWRKAYGGLKANPGKRMKDLERENPRLERLAPSGAQRPWSKLGANTGCRRGSPVGCSRSRGARSAMCLRCGRRRTCARRR